jgi:hypothetical protein
MHPSMKTLSFAMGRLLCFACAELASRVRGGPLRLVQDHRTLVGPRLLNVGRMMACEMRRWLTSES